MQVVIATDVLLVNKNIGHSLLASFLYQVLLYLVPFRELIKFEHHETCDAF